MQMGLIGKAFNGIFGNLKNKVSQGIQGAKRFGGNAWDTAKQGISKSKNFIYDNREQIGGALKAASPFIAAINPAWGMAAGYSGNFLSNLSSGPVKDKLINLANDTYQNNDIEVSPPRRNRRQRVTSTSPNSKTVTQYSGAQRRYERKLGKLMTQA